MKNKKAELTWTVIIVAAIALIVLVAFILFLQRMAVIEIEEDKLTDDLNMTEEEIPNLPINESVDTTPTWSLFEGECITNNDCYGISYGDWKECINYTCVSRIDDCKQVAKIDYGFQNPHCRYVSQCYCDEYVIDSPAKRIEKNNSIQIIDEIGHHEDYVVFELKPTPPVINESSLEFTTAMMKPAT